MKRWSTKDAEVVQAPAEGRPGEAIIHFSDRYSVYDFGPLPEEVPGKGAASCAMAVRSFGLLADRPRGACATKCSEARRTRRGATEGVPAPASPGR